MGQMRANTNLDYWSLAFQTNGTAALGPGPPPGVGGDKYGPTAPEAGLLQPDGAELPGRE